MVCRKYLDHRAVCCIRLNLSRSLPLTPRKAYYIDRIQFPCATARSNSNLANGIGSAVMDARLKESPQSYRSGIKRPWEDDTKPPAQQNGSCDGWHGGTLPPIEGGSFSQNPVSRNSKDWATQNSQYTQNKGGSVAKRVHYEGNDYNAMPRVDLDAPGKMPPSQIYYTNRYDHKRSTQSASTFGKMPRVTASGRVNAPQDMPSLCRQCRRQTTFDQEEESLPECCEHCQKNPELALVTQACSIGLTQLAETLRSGIDSEKRGINPAHSQLRLLPSGDPPPIIDFGLKQTLHWILSKINKVNELADKFVQQVPSGVQKPYPKKDVLGAINSVTRGGPLGSMKRRIDDDHQRTMPNNLDTPDPRMHQRRRSLAMSASEELQPIRTYSPHQNSPLSVDKTSQQLSSMIPPPAPNRQLPSPPGRAFPSPKSVNFLSPSGPASYGGPPGGPPHSSNLHASSNILPPIAGTKSSDSALQVHTAALQHEISIQKIAFSSLQGEHDKLLAAFSRSQSRASALEKKHQVSDTEIFSLTEEKARLHAQVLELEGDVEDLAKSRDSYRQAAVQEGAQYVEIVKMASQLEEKTGEERKKWNKLKLEMEQRIEELSAGMKANTKGSSNIPFVPEGLERDIASTSGDQNNEGPVGTRMIEPTDDAQLGAQDDLLKAEIERLRKRCEEMDSALRGVKQESRSMESIVEALSKAGKNIVQKVESVSLSPETHPEPQPDPRSESDNDQAILEG
ncbi:hypothetical protein EYC80_002537 [Monilinia laxa]|uniref:Uncharacterized protein n=1 Tax=Monilinia laxa TaxID=61186 RepID=A0A5N6K468_MONLA|nr:hypothetical protein EYC80_002537 [Monilinia laxa]